MSTGFPMVLLALLLVSTGTALASAIVATRVAKRLRSAHRRVDKIPLLEEGLESLRDTISTLATRDRMRQLRAKRRDSDESVAPDPQRDPEGYRRYLESKHAATFATLRAARKPN